MVTGSLQGPLFCTEWVMGPQEEENMGKGVLGEGREESGAEKETEGEVESEE